MKVLLTGATGFVGRHLERMLSAAGHDVICLVRKQGGIDREILWDFKSELPSKVPDYDALVHLAAQVDFSNAFNKDQYDTNTLATHKLAMHAGERKVCFLFASSISVHGSLSGTVDLSSSVNPSNHYAMSKYLAEEIVRDCVADHGIMRISGIYGIDGPGHLGLNGAITNAVRSKKAPVLKGRGTAKRNYISVTDMARWILGLLERRRTRGIACAGGVRDILYCASSEVMTIEDYLQAIVDVVLPGGAIERLEGNDGADMIVTPSPAPMAFTPFREYLKSVSAGGEGAASR